MGESGPCRLVDEVLCCPGCGGNYLHHGAVAIYERDGEDGPTTVVTSDLGSLADVIRPNPSSRRDAVGILMECEMCGPVGELCIVQHKGQTFVEWRA